ncbi:MAG: polyribonucleotide nucleotidyltransferase [Candidatus Omnitrophica bacterium]|nr:polyribonucleotide nucleotidyltransferase [Candidatus Omnitrophota bacterium]
MTTQVTGNIGSKELIIETGKLARQADGAVTVQLGGTVVFSAVVADKNEPKEERDFFPLFVDYRERTYAAGKIPGGFFKREARPSEREILTCRLTDRTLRPLFPKDYLNEVNISSIVLSADGENNPDIVGMIAASAALMISPIPFYEPIGAVRVGYIDEQFVINPTFDELENSTLDLVLAGTKANVNMIEAGALEVSEELMLQAIEVGHRELIKIIEIQEELQKKCGKEKGEVTPHKLDADTAQKVRKATDGKFQKIHLIKDKGERNQARQKLYDTVLTQFPVDDPEFKDTEVKRTFSHFESEDVRHLIVHGKKRPDGRLFEDIRDITCEIEVLPRTHGTGLFTRGQTQCLAVATLGTKADEQRIDALEGESKKNFMLHYNFPGFSVGEVKPNRGPGRREIGHGALAERALKAVMPDEESFPYTVRIVADVMESNGSSSMASVCAGTLCMMDAGIPIKRPVSGIAMGLITEGDDYEILTDIAGMEDHLGDMDFKVAGTHDGITALQLDLKIKGISFDIIRKAFQQAKKARLAILDKMTSVIDKPRSDLSVYAPRIQILQIKTSKIKDVIGPGGKVIRRIIEETGVKIDIDDTGKILIASSDAEASRKAIEQIEAIVEEVEVGKCYTGAIKRILNFGAFCEILPGTDGLIHISELSSQYINKVEDVVKIGNVVTVKVIGVDGQGRINLSLKAAQEGNSNTQNSTEKG